MQIRRGYLLLYGTLSRHQHLTPNLKGFHTTSSKTIDGWRPKGDNGGWKMRRDRDVLLERSEVMESQDLSSKEFQGPEFVRASWRFKDDLASLPYNNFLQAFMTEPPVVPTRCNKQEQNFKGSVILLVMHLNPHFSLETTRLYIDIMDNSACLSLLRSSRRFFQL